MKRDIHGRFSKNNTIEFSLPSFSFIVKYFLLLIVLLPWIHLVIYKINIGKLIEELLFTLFGPDSCDGPDSCETKKNGKAPY